jgi:hypothetical protein
MLAVFSIGVAIGSLLCESLSEHKVEIGLVPVGSIGLTLFCADLGLASLQFVNMTTLAPSASVLGWGEFLAADGSCRVLADITLIGVFGGLFIVPLYAYVQLNTHAQRQSRVISANNILNALFMVVAAGMAAGLLAAGLSVPQLVLVCAGLNTLAAVYLYRTMPGVFVRFVRWVVEHKTKLLKR